MKITRHSAEQIVRKLREADRLLAENTPLAEAMRSLGVSHQGSSGRMGNSVALGLRAKLVAQVALQDFSCRITW